jgi:Domain of unknown function (DUF4347)
MRALEPRFMFDGAVAATTTKAVTDAALADQLAHTPAPVEVQAANTSLDGSKKEVVFVDTSLSNYKDIESKIKSGVAIEEIDGTQSGLAQIAVWAQTHTGYDSISLIGASDTGTFTFGTDAFSHTALSADLAQADLSQMRQALNPNGDVLLFGSTPLASSDAVQLTSDIAVATNAHSALFTDPTDVTTRDGNWDAQAVTASIDAHGPFDSASALADASLAIGNATNGVVRDVTGAQQVIFIDSGLQNLDALVAATPANTDVVLLDPTQNGIDQITSFLQSHSGFDAIHIVSHGDVGQVMIGDTLLSDLTLPSYAAELATWGQALSSHGEILLYGCSVAQGDAGQQFVYDLAHATGAVIAASNDATGSSNYGGNWSLETVTGVAVASAIDFSSYGWNGDLTAPTVYFAHGYQLYIGTQNSITTPYSTGNYGRGVDFNASTNVGWVSSAAYVSTSSISFTASAASTASSG